MINASTMTTISNARNTIPEFPFPESTTIDSQTLWHSGWNGVSVSMVKSDDILNLLKNERPFQNENLYIRDSIGVYVSGEYYSQTYIGYSSRCGVYPYYHGDALGPGDNCGIVFPGCWASVCHWWGCNCDCNAGYQCDLKTDVNYTYGKIYRYVYNKWEQRSENFRWSRSFVETIVNKRP